MEKINYIRSIISILIVFILSSIVCSPYTQKSRGIYITKKSTGTAKPESQFTAKQEGKKLAKNKLIIQLEHISSFINYHSGINTRQAGFYLQKQFAFAPASASLNINTRLYLVERELLI